MIEVALAGAVPSASEAWDQAQALGRALLATGRFDVVRVRVNANHRSAVRFRADERSLQLSVHWRVVQQIDDLVALVIGGSPPAPAAAAPGAGSVHDLAAVAEAEQIWLPHPAKALVCWGKWPTRAPHRAIRFGACLGSAQAEIRIHPVLDHPTVPTWYVGFVVFHELLHIAIPPTGFGRRRALHGPEFAAVEATHPEYHRARAWEVRALPGLVERIAARINASGP